MEVQQKKKVRKRKQQDEEVDVQKVIVINPYEEEKQGNINLRRSKRIQQKKQVFDQDVQFDGVFKQKGKDVHQTWGDIEEEIVEVQKDLFTTDELKPAQRRVIAKNLKIQQQQLMNNQIVKTSLILNTSLTYDLSYNEYIRVVCQLIGIQDVDQIFHPLDGNRAIIERFDQAITQQDNEVRCDIIYQTIALLIVLSYEYKEQQYNDFFEISQREFEWMCQSSTAASWDGILQYKQEIDADIDKVFTEIGIEEQKQLFFKQMFFYLFQDVTLSAEKYQQIIAKDNVLNPHPEWMQSPEFLTFYGHKEQWNDVFSFIEQNTTRFDVYEDICKRLNVSKMQILQSYNYIFNLRRSNFINEEAGDKLKSILNYWFLPRSLKDVSQIKDDEMSKNYIKPFLGSICHHLIFVSIYISQFSQIVYADRYHKDTQSFKVQWSHQNMRADLVQGLVDFIGENNRVARGRYAQNFDNAMVRFGTIHIKSDRGKFIQRMDLHESGGGLTEPESGQKYYLEGNVVRCDREFNNLQNGVKLNNLDLFAVLIYELKSRQSILDIQQCVHFISIVMSGSNIEYQVDKSELKERHYMTVHLAIKDLDKLGEFKADSAQYATNLKTYVAAAIQNKIIRCIAEQLDYYDDGNAPPIDVAQLDFASLAVEKYNIYSLPEGSDLTHRVIGFDEEENQFKYFVVEKVKGAAGGYQIVAYNKGNIVYDRDYKESVIDQYEDDDSFSCVFNVASYIWCETQLLTHNKQTKLQFMQSKEYRSLYKDILCNNVNEVFSFFKQKGQKIVLFFPQSFLLYQSELISDAIWIYVKLGHTWIGKKEPCFTRIAQFYQHNHKNQVIYKVPFDSKNKGCHTRNQYVFYDIETLKNIGKKEHMKPILLCFETVGVFNERQSIFGLDCCDKFVDYLDELNEKLNIYFQDIKQKDGKKRDIKYKIYVYAHNGGRFDHLFLQKQIYFKHANIYQFLGTSSNIKYSAYQNIVFRDSVMLIPGKLKDLCKEFKVVQKQDFDAKDITMEMVQDQQFKQKLIEYCENDVKCLKELFFKFIQTLEKSIKGFTSHDIKQTLPSTALHVFQKFFLKGVTIYGNINQEQGNLIQHYERLSYFGGHTQVFRHGVQNSARYFDFVSMYVSIMSANKYPISQGDIQWARQDEQPQQMVLYIIKSFKFSDQSKITNLPVRNRKNNVSIYPLQYEYGDVGNEYLAFWGEELILAKKLGLESVFIVKKICYKEWKAVFKEYMDTFFDMKKTSEEAIAKIAKLFGNSLYGKWGQNCEGQRKLINTSELRLIGLNNMVDVINHKGVRNIPLKQQKFQETVISSVKELSDGVSEIVFEADQSVYNQPGSLVRLASYTTMKGRCQIIEVINNIGYENIFYCDTDSVVFRDDPNINMGVNIGKERGDIADQFPGLKILECDFVAAKCYYVKLNGKYKGSDEYVRFKGVSNSKSYQIKELREHGKVKVDHEYWRRSWDGVGIYQTVKEIVLGTKRFVEKDGHTRPFINYNEYNLYAKKNLLYINNQFIYE